MSRENVEIVRALQPQPEWDLVTLLSDEATAAAMTDGFAPHFHDDLETLAVGLQSLRYTGLAGLRDAWLEWLEPWESYRVEIEGLIDAGDDVVVLTRDYGRRPGMTAEVSITGTAVWTVRDGKIARARFYAHRDEALEAVGLGK
ncbi:MAG: nuclear transport factor 2 family protein [Actinomycetota bacterium]|nr:nuclear transport factor 2 family protein [Actinomycetota bacterium]